MNQGEFFALESLARPIATKLADDIIKVALKQYPREELKAGQFASLIAEMTLQIMLTSLILSKQEPGSEVGEKAIVELYKMYSDATVKRWHKNDLKEARKAGRI